MQGFSFFAKVKGQNLNLFYTIQVLETLSKVMDTNPDHLEAQGVEHMYNLLSSPQVPNSELWS